MGSPSKRPRLEYSSEPEDNAELEEDLDKIGLEQARAQNDLRLKSIFEGIFEKYGKDFTEIGDEIDLNTGDIVVNNGHVFTMEEEDDTGEKENFCESDGDLSGSTTEEAYRVTVKSLTDFMEAENGGDILGYESTESQNEPITTPLQTGLNPTESREQTESEATNLDADTDADGLSSMDLVTGISLNVQNDPKQPIGPGQDEDTGKSVTEKAKSAAGTPTQSKNDTVSVLSEPVESIWRVPEIDAPFLTPNISKPHPNPSFNNIRSASPPGQGSIWALPRRSTGGTKSRKAKKPRVSSAKRKHHSSPIMYDWSFAEARDESESDDPLQEDHQPSPTPKSLAVRGKWPGPDVTPRRTINRCNFCMKTFPPDEYLSHLRTLIESDIDDSQHDLAEVKKQLEVLSGESLLKPRQTPSSETTTHNTSIENSSPAVDSRGRSAQDQVSTPTKRVRTGITPDEARLIITMRQIQGRPWKEILNHFPHRTLQQLIQWHTLHWSERMANPPRLTKPWSEIEKQTLDELKDEEGLDWPSFRVAFRGRSLAEIEFELLRQWVGRSG